MTSDVVKHRMPPRAIVVSIVDTFLGFVGPILIAMLAGGVDRFLEGGIALIVGVGAAVGGSSLLGALRWYTLRYWFEGGQFCLEQGVLFRRRTAVPIEKIQAVDITAGLSQRLLGLVKLEVKSGAAGSQIKISAVTRDEAERIQRRLRVEDAATSDDVDVDESSRGYRLTPRQLLLAGATSGRLGVVAGAVAWLFAQFDEILIERLTATLETDIDPEKILQTDPLLVAGLVVAGVLISWLGSVVWELVTYGGFGVKRRGEDLVVKRGIFEQRQVTLPANRVQALRYRETFLRQLVGHGTLYVEAVGHQEEKGKSTVLHPFLSRADCQSLIADLLPKFDIEFEYLRPPKRALPRFLIKPSVVVALPPLALALVWPTALFGLALLPAVWFLGYVSWRDVGLSLGPEIAVVRSRSYLRRTTAFVLRRTTQTIATTAAFFQRRRDLATVALTVATGPVGRTFKARDLDGQRAWESLEWVTTPPETLRASFAASHDRDHDRDRAT